MLELRGRPERASSQVARVEVLRAVGRAAPEQLVRARRALGDIVLIDLHAEIQEAAARLPPPGLRSLDAIHIATAQSLGDALGPLITYDARMVEAARAAGLTVEGPA